MLAQLLHSAMTVTDPHLQEVATCNNIQARYINMAHHQARLWHCSASTPLLHRRWQTPWAAQEMPCSSVQLLSLFPWLQGHELLFWLEQLPAINVYTVRHWHILQGAEDRYRVFSAMPNNRLSTFSARYIKASCTDVRLQSALLVPMGPNFA